jgi:cytochrome c oxidase subunit 4
MLLAVFAALVVLTMVTVAAAGFASGDWEIWIALSIASLKAALVAAYFMHLRYDNPFHTLLLVSALAFVTLFLALTLADTQAYQSAIEEYLRRS